jgi:hypothetical protein
MQQYTGKQTNFQDPYHQGVTHKISGTVEHGTVIVRVEHFKVIKNAGIEANVNDQERNEK